MSKYPQIEKNGVEINWKKDIIHLSCCDCGLVHSIEFFVKKDKMIMKMKRLNRATGQIRRHNNIKIKQGG